MSQPSGLPANLRERWARWVGYWSAQGDLRPLALFRIGWAIAVLLETHNEAARLERYTPVTRSGLEQFHWPFLPFATPVDADLFATLLEVANVGGALALFGALPRLGAALVVGAHGWLFSVSLLNFRNHIYLLLLFGLILTLAPSGRVWSVNSVVRRLWTAQWDSRIGPLWASRLLKWQTFLVYFYAVLHKADLRFLEGWPMQVEMKKHLPRSLFGGWIASGGSLSFLGDSIRQGLDSEPFMATLSFGVLAGEGFLCFGLLVPWLRRYAAALGVALHLSIFFLMNVVTFGVLMVSAYPLFLTDPAPRAPPDGDPD